MNIKNLLTLFLLLTAAMGWAQKKSPVASQTSTIDASLFSGMAYRSVGPTRGGRATAVAGVPSRPFTFYMGSTGGGVWRTGDAGTTWQNISDGQIEAGSIGAIEVAPSDDQVIYVGTGSACLRGNVSGGIGMYRSTDGGAVWQPIGLENAGQIAKIVIHPSNPDQVWVAALGNAFMPNEERGVYRSDDGGKTWKKTLFLNKTTGAIDLAIHPANPRILYAAMWRAERKPWTIIDGSEDGGIYKSTDGGLTWDKLAGALPTGVLGRIGLAVSPANPDRVWAIIQAAAEEAGGLYRSDDAGASWSRINRDHRLRQRGWYYSHITADPQDENTLYASNTGFYRSIDGGKSFDRIGTPHGDNHGVWINPSNTDIMINCNDGGANVSLNGGQTWSTQLNQPTSEFYRITVDHQFPYRLYAGQQDNTTISVPSEELRTLTETESWYEVGGGESADVAIDPRDPDIIYAGTYSGEITYVNRKTGERRQVTPYPHYTEGTRQRDLKYRFQWNYPLFASVHEPGTVYIASNYVHKSTDQGQTWQVVSPDLTNKLDQYHDIPGGPVQHDGTGVEIYSTIFALEESLTEKGVIWAGSDDGRIHLTRDGGNNWQDITPREMPVEGTVNKIELSAHDPARALVAVYKYRDGDFRPYIFLTNDYGKSWKLLTNGSNGIPANHFVRAVAEDTKVKGLIYAGTEYGMYVSFTDGTSWQSLQLNLPHVPITDIEIAENDLVLSTQGRAFWILDDLAPLQQAKKAASAANHFLYEVEDTYRTNVGGWYGLGATIRFYLKNPAEKDTVYLRITDSNGRLAALWSSFPEENAGSIDSKEGFQSVKWNLGYPAPKMADNFVSMEFSAGREPGPQAVPGTYLVGLTVGDWKSSTSFEVKIDPRWTGITAQGLTAKFELEQEIIALINESQEMVREIRSIRQQANSMAANAVKAGYDTELKELADRLDEKLTSVEDQIIQNKIETSQDEINFPRVFSNHIARLYRVVVDEHNHVTGGMTERWEDLKTEFSGIRTMYEAVKATELKAFTNALTEAEIAYILYPQK